MVETDNRDLAVEYLWGVRGIMECLAIIPARGGSKGILRKNVRLIAGKPLLAHSIEQALSSKLISRVVVSTDDSEIAVVTQQYGAKVVWRPAEISGDTATSESALLHALDHLRDLENYQPDLVVFLQCTSPIRLKQDIDSAIQVLIDDNADSLLSVVRSHAFLCRVMDEQAQSFNYDYRSRPRRQDRQTEYRENGSIYVFKPWVLRRFDNRLGGKIVLYEMDGKSAIDIDSMWDFELCEWVMSHSL